MTSRKIRVIDRFHYAFDNFMAKGTPSLIGGLTIISALFILLMALIIQVGSIHPGEASERWSFPETIWGVLMRTMDTGTVGGDQGWLFRLVMLLVTLGGIFVISTLIGLIGSGIEEKLQELRKGRSRVIETEHTVILGWSFQIFTLLSELLLANANRKNACIVILSERDKVEMEDTIASWLGSQPRTRIVCRTGDPSNMTDLDMVNIEAAKSIIVLNPTSEEGDISLIKTLLAITNLPSSLPYHIVAQVQEKKTLSLLPLIGGEQIEPLLSNDLISRVIVQTLRQSGLSTVYMELFDFEGNEIYFVFEPSLMGKTYGEILRAYEDSAVIGFYNSTQGVYLNPPASTLLAPDTQLILITEDDDTARLNAQVPEIQPELITSAPDGIICPEHTLILNWNYRIYDTITELDGYVSPGSSVTVVAEEVGGEQLLKEHCADLQHQQVHFFWGDPTERQVLEKVDAPNFDHILVLCNDRLDHQRADAATLVTLLQLRSLTQNNPKSIIAEMLDARNQILAEAAQPDDFVISEQIISRLLAQVSEQKRLNQVFASLLSAEGAEVYLKPVTNYVNPGQLVTFYTVVEAALRQGQTAIGYRLKVNAYNRAKASGVVVNPKKSDRVTFTTEDHIIVIAEH